MFLFVIAHSSSKHFHRKSGIRYTNSALGKNTGSGIKFQTKTQVKLLFQENHRLQLNSIAIITSQLVLLEELMATC